MTNIANDVTEILLWNFNFDTLRSPRFGPCELLTAVVGQYHIYDKLPLTKWTVETAYMLTQHY